MKTDTGWKALFNVAALYDGVLGAAFLAAAPTVFRAFGVAPPNHWGYVQFAGALLLVFALMFARIAADPRTHRGLIDYGILLKIAYCGVVGAHWLTGGVPFMWKPFWVADFMFLVLFAAARVSLKPASEPAKG